MLDKVVYANWRNLIKPMRLERDNRSNENYGKFIAKPLERGFGITLGNALRRVLLSSLNGAAITSVKIDGVLHQFECLPGIIEDVTDIILNLKQVQIDTNEPNEFVGLIDVTASEDGMTEVLAGAIDLQGKGTITNPKLRICTLTQGASFKAEVSVKMDKGYIAAPSSVPGTINIDAIHTPVSRVKYTVTNARVGHRTDYDKLTLEIWTKGALLPEDALAYSAKILREQLQLFINFSEAEEPEVSPSPVEEEYNENLLRRIDEFELSLRSSNCLQNAGIEYVYQLVERSESEMLKTRNFGRKSLNEIKELLASLNLSLGMKLHNFPRPT